MTRRRSVAHLWPSRPPMKSRRSSRLNPSFCSVCFSDPRRWAVTDRRSAFCENPLDHVDGNPVDPRDLGSRQSRISPRRGCEQIASSGSRALSAPQRRLALRFPRNGPAPATTPSVYAVYAPIGRLTATSPKPIVGDLPFCREESLGRPMRSRDPLSLIVPRG